MRGLGSTIALIAVLAGLGGYIYFVAWKQPAEPASKLEKVFVGFQADKVQELKVTSDKGDVTTLKKENGAWQVVSPVAAKADEGEVSGINSALGQVEVSRVIDENATDLKEYGLATPRIQIDFKATGDTDYKHLLVGDKSPTGSDLFARRNDEKKVFLIPAFQENTFNKSAFDLRDKTVMKFERDKVDGIDLNAGGKTVQLVKNGAEWKVSQPVQARADFGAVEGLIGKLQTAAMKSSVTETATLEDLKKYGLDKPSATVDMKMGSARATLAFGGKAGDNTIYARDASKAAVVTVDSALAEDLKKGAEEYRRKDIFEFRAYNANRVEITRNGQTVVFEKVKGDGKDKDVEKWRRVSPNPGDLDRDKIDAMLSRLSNVRATSFVDASTKTGLNAPVMSVAAKFDEGKKEDRVSFGKVDDKVYVSLPGESGAATIDPSEFNETTKSLDELSK